MPQRSKTEKQNLRSSLKQFLNLQSKIEPSTKYCTDCGSVCMHLPATFWLDGDQESFSIWLPFCPDCNPEFFARMPVTDQ